MRQAGKILDVTQDPSMRMSRTMSQLFAHVQWQESLLKAPSSKKTCSHSKIAPLESSGSGV